MSGLSMDQRSPRTDVPAWSRSGSVIDVRARPRIAHYLSWPAWLKLARPHQWLKNGLIAVPLFTAHQFTGEAVLHMLIAVTAFCVCASSAYILNDVVDVQSDRSHPNKRNRPLACGELPIRPALIIAPTLLALAIAIAALVSFSFFAVLVLYYVGTLAYTFFLKRAMLIDVVTLACLYTLRVVAGGAAIGVPISEWLLAFSTFLFLSLALIKRHAEMTLRIDAGLPDPNDRAYKLTDLPVITALAGAAGYCAVIVFALYVSSETARELYTRPQVLWLVCPAILYWVSRMLLLSHRRLLHDDPILFAMQDKVSLVTVGLIFFLVLVAI